MDMMSDARWCELKDDLWQKRKNLVVVPRGSPTKERIYNNRIRTIAEIQDRSGMYFVVETSKNVDSDYRDQLTESNAKGAEYKDGIIWTNSEYVYDEIRQAIAKYEIGKDGDMRGGIRRGINRQLRRRAWEEYDVSWIMYMDWNGEFWDEVSGEYLDKEGVKKARYEEMLELKSMTYTQLFQRKNVGG